MGDVNIAFGWAWMMMGLVSGSILGMWSFNGPLRPPKGFDEYDSLPRRQVRLAHVATFALPVINILYGTHLDMAQVSLPLKELGSYSMLVLMIGIPVTLVAASIKPILKYTSVIPVVAGFIGIGIIAFGYL